ncbi:hypothetical protein GCM10022228_05810 [Halomonas cibimaris]|uniref:Uncharacterized protein n=1 Tax=Halomonas cibimaris TaxID=657012 RepID=A0ABP7LEP9_9GAMM
MRDDPAALFGAVFPGGQLLGLAGAVFGGALFALGLDFLHAPALLTGQFTFAHGTCRLQRLNGTLAYLP